MFVAKFCLLLLSVTSQATDSVTLDFIGDILRANPPSVVSAFLCWKPGHANLLARHLSEKNILLSTQTVVQDAVTQLRATERGKYVTFIVDMSCQGTPDVLEEADVLTLFDARSRWILLGNATRGHSLLAELRILIDSDVLVADRVSVRSFILLEMYRRRHNDTIITTVIGEWGQQYGLRMTASPVLSSRRTNFHRSVLKAVMVVVNNDSLLHLTDTIDRHIDTMSKVNYALFCNVMDILNASVEMAVTNSWGYKVNGSWTGMAGYLESGDADVGATALYITESRSSVLTYLAGTTRTRNAFLFRQPPLSFVDNIFILPFSGSVWLTSVALVAVIGFLLRGALSWEHSKPKVTWSDMALLAVGAVCQQGITVEAQRVPGRIITISLFLIVIFLYTSYSACIVALLQSSTTSIRTLYDLLHSGLTLGAYDTVYNRHFFKAASDPVRRAIYTQKVSPAGGPQRFLPLEDGIKKMRTSPFAFHVELGPGFKFVSDTFLEDEKCSLQTITFFTEFTEPHVAVRKNSAFKEILTVSYRKVHERGLKHRENMRFYHAKPECANRGTSFVSVGLQECYSAMLVLCYGMLLSLGILMAEIFVNRRKSNIWSVGGMLLKVEKRNTRRRTCPSASYSTTDLTGTELGSNPGLGGETQANNGLGLGKESGRR